MRLLLIPLLMLATQLAAHPLDDRAQMASEVVIAGDTRLEYVLDFRYLDAVASLSEIHGTAASPGLDADRDGIITALELEQRYDRLVLEMAFSFGIEVDGARVDLKPDFARFVFADVNRAQPLDLAAGVPVDGLRIHYRFVFTWDAPVAATREVAYHFSGLQSVVHTPGEQMVAIDARVSPRERIRDVRYDTVMGAFPRLTFRWLVTRPEPPAVTRPGPTDGVPEVSPPDTQDEGVARGPAWLTLIAGLLLALFGLVSAGLKLAGKSGRRGLGGSLIAAVAGVAITALALFRLGLAGGG